jgi:hypothetical protein
MVRRLPRFLLIILLARPAAAAPHPFLSGANLDLIDNISRRSFLYFSEQTDPVTGLTLDRAPFSPSGRKDGPASISATGFALTAFCIAQQHHWITRENAETRTRRTLVFFTRHAPRKNGWFYHFMDAETGRRTLNSEVSSIDTAFLLAGVLTVRSCFSDDAEIVSLATQLFNDVDFPWMMNGSPDFFSLGWTPESGFLSQRWSTYSELLILYVLAIGSPTHPISGATWDRWKIYMNSVCGDAYIGGGPLFIHQYPLAWIDLRDRVPPALHPNYLLNSILATRAQRLGFIELLAPRFPRYSANIWGLTASDSRLGYIDWGTSFNDPRIDGTVAPSAAAGSLMFTPEICLPALQTMQKLYGEKAFGRYGFADAFNPATGWDHTAKRGESAHRERVEMVHE